jgi:hypothetical protein
MPILVVVSVLVQLTCAVHAVKTGRIYPWLFIVIFFPLIGSLVYALTQILPDMQSSAAARRLAKGVAQAVDPDRDLRTKARNLAVADTVENKKRLAEEYLDRGLYEQAADLYEQALSPPFETEPSLMLALARARYGEGRHADVIAVLDRLREANPDYASSDGHLLYARSLAESGRLDRALSEYEYLADYFPGEEARARYAARVVRIGPQPPHTPCRLDRAAKLRHDGGRTR